MPALSIFEHEECLRGSVWSLPEPNNQASEKDDGNDSEDDDGEAVDDKDIMREVKLARKASTSTFPTFFPSFLCDISPGHSAPGQKARDLSTNSIPLNQCPRYSGKVFVYKSAVATYYTPSDLSGLGGMFRKRIRSVESWRSGPERRDCVFVEQDVHATGFQGMFVGQVLAFLKLKHNHVTYPCAVVSWFSTVGNSHCPQTGMWIVQRDLDANGDRELAIIHLDTILRATHLIGIAGSTMIPKNLPYYEIAF